MAIDTLVFIEENGRFPEWLSSEDTALLCIEQEERESTAEFLVRAEHFVRELHSPSVSGVLVSGSAGGRATEEARRALLLAMVDHLEIGGGGKLVLVADGDYVSRQSFADLAWELSGFLDDLDSAVSCRLRAQPRSVPTATATANCRSEVRSGLNEKTWRRATPRRRLGVDESAELTFGCVPHTDDDQTRGQLGELAKFLSAELQVRVSPHRSPSPLALASAFGSGRLDIAWVSPALLLTAPEMARAVPLVCSVRSGMSTYHGVLFVEASSPLRSPSDLAGARAAWVAPTSAAGYIVPRLALASHGLDPRSLFSSETFHDSHGNVARAVFSGRADVGATFALFENGEASQKLLRAGFHEAEEGKARILYAAGPIPSDPIVVRHDLSSVLRARLIAALSEVPRASETVRQALAHTVGADTFEAVRPHAFDTLREQISDGRALGLLDELPERA